MTSTTIKIVNPTGIHTRPGSAIAKKAKEFSCDIKFKHGDKLADAKSMLHILKLGLAEGDEVELLCEGENEEEAIAMMADFMSTLID